MLECNLGNAVGNGAANEVEMPGFALNNATEAYDCVQLPIAKEDVCPARELIAAGYLHHLDVFLRCTVFYQSLISAIQQSSGHFGIPLRNNNTESVRSG